MKIYPDCGFTILDVLMSLVILGFITVSVISLFSLGIQRMVEAGDYFKAIQIAEAEMENFMAVAPENLWDLAQTSKKMDEENFNQINYHIDTVLPFDQGELLLLSVEINWETPQREMDFQLQTYRYVQIND